MNYNAPIMKAVDRLQNKEKYMDSIVRWYRNNYVEITWFIIGWLSLDLIREFGHGNWAGVVFDTVLITLNYHLNKK